jgi:hypothetical protein
MHMQLICLYDKGRRLSRAELEDAPRYTGNFVIEEWPANGQFSGSAASRTVLAARIFEPHPTARRELLPPLFEPACIKVDDSKMIFTGWIIQGDADGQPVHFVQSWVLKPAEPDA